MKLSVLDNVMKRTTESSLSRFIETHCSNEPICGIESLLSACLYDLHTQEIASGATTVQL